MFYAQQKAYPFDLLKDADKNSITTVERIEDCKQFKTRKEAEKYLFSLGIFKNDFEVLNSDPIKAEVYRSDQWVACGEFDNRAQLEKYLRTRRILREWEKISLYRSKITENYIVQIIRK